MTINYTTRSLATECENSSKLTATGSTAAHIVPNSRAADSLNSTWLFGPVNTPPTFLRPSSVSPAYNRNKITHSRDQLIAADGFV